MDLKKCCACKEKKDRSEFNRSCRTKDGLQGICRPCANAKAREWRRKNPERQRALVKRWEKANPQRRAESEAKRREREPEKIQARRDLNSAVYSGKILKPDSCERCGKKCKSRALHGHHEDYSKPLEVEWLCQRCHVAEHQTPLIMI